MHQGIILVVTHVLKPTVAQQQMNNQQQHREAMTEDRADFQMPETAGELLLQSEATEQGLKQDQAGERGQPLVFEAKLWNAMGLAMNAGFATLCVNGLRWFYC